MTAPSKHSPSVTRNSHLSFSKRLGIVFLRMRSIWIPGVALQLVNELLENTAAMFVVLELIKTRAGWSQQHDVSGVSCLSGELHRVVQRFRAPDRHATFDLLLDFVRGAADQQREYGFFSKRRAQLRVI